MLKQNASIGLGFFGIYIATQGVAVLAIPYYHMVVKLDPFYLGLTLAIPVLISAMLNPLVGRLFDDHPYFCNKPLIIIVSACLSSLLFALIWQASPNWSHFDILIYLNLVLLAFAVSLTFLSLAAKCLVFEIFNDQIELGKQLGINAFAEKVGSLVYYWLFPIAQFIFVGNVFEGIKYIGWIIAIFCIGGFSMTMALLNMRGPSIKQVKQLDRTVTSKISAQAHLLIKKKVYWLLLNCFLMFALLGVFVSFDYYLLVYFMFDGNITQGAYWKGILSTAYGVFGMIYIPFIVKYSNVIPLYKVLRFAYVLILLGGPVKWFVFQTGHQYFLIFDAMLGAAGWATIATIAPKMLGKVAQEVQASCGVKIFGWLNARHNLILSISAVLALSGSGLILKLSGFNVLLPIEANAQALEIIKYVFVFGTSAMGVLLLLLSYNKHRII